MRKLILSALFALLLVSGNANAKCVCEVWSPVAIAAERAVPPANLATTVINGAMLGEQTGIVREKIAANHASLMTDFYTMNPADPNIVIERHRPYCSRADVDGGRCDKAAAPTMRTPTSW